MSTVVDSGFDAGDDMGAVALYGGPPVDLGTDAPPTPDAAYGGPPLDMSQPEDAGEDFGPIAAYGAPPGEEG